MTFSLDPHQTTIQSKLGGMFKKMSHLGFICLIQRFYLMKDLNTLKALKYVYIASLQHIQWNTQIVVFFLLWKTYDLT